MPDSDQASRKDAVKIDELKTSLNLQTSKISWHELQRFYASGSVIGVAEGMDLIEVACQLHLDNKAVVEQWLNDAQVFTVDDDMARHWFEQQRFEQQATHWAVVVAPWVLVQVVSKE